ncbi:hypothetical protein [Dyella koreensis]|uniref:Uncharacterized protein n=1 Tax=Dyella koreensis TaxID=311235 RepID=A0ABW8K7Y8_9GAMM
MSFAMPQTVVVRAVIVEVDAHLLRESVRVLEGELITAIHHAHTGEFDGYDIGQGTLRLFMYGPSAELLFRSVESVLRHFPLTQGASVTLRQGPPGALFRVVRLGESPEIRPP